MRFQTILGLASATILTVSSGAAAAQRVLVLPIQIWKHNQMMVELPDQRAGGTTIAMISIGRDKVPKPYRVPLSLDGTPDPTYLPPGFTAMANYAKKREVDLLPDGSVPPATAAATPTTSGRRTRPPRRRVQVAGVTKRLRQNMRDQV
ncbi:hypothetical protein PspLS_00150 [Pyricularia sp. CBS 133598]|nr:hypothetical protein PspLS_00150 [Pyricularia sp. CBS 133598]